jgi:RNA polymerase sigma-70 factor, ECF subfamily
LGDKHRVDERECITRLKGGDISGLETLVKRHQSEALKVAYLVTHDYAMAEDIVQNAFVRAYERIEQFDESRPFGPWFLRSVVNDAAKAVSRHAHLSLDVVAHASNSSGFADPELSVQETFEQAETREEVWAALRKLSPIQRAAIVMYYYLDLSESEMSTAMNRPTGTVRRRLFDARQRLRSLLPARTK